MGVIKLPVAFASRSLKKAERNYSTTDREGLAVKWAVEYFHPYIFGTHFTIITDHSALKAMKDKALLKGRLLRWAEFLAEYDYDIVYRAGKDNVVADYLSRAVLTLSINESSEYVD